jgi:hypothetical protein
MCFPGKMINMLAPESRISHAEESVSLKPILHSFVGHAREDQLSFSIRSHDQSKRGWLPWTGTYRFSVRIQSIALTGDRSCAKAAQAEQLLIVKIPVMCINISANLCKVV